MYSSIFGKIKTEVEKVVTNVKQTTEVKKEKSIDTEIKDLILRYKHDTIRDRITVDIKIRYQNIYKDLSDDQKELYPPELSDTYKEKIDHLVTD